MAQESLTADALLSLIDDDEARDRTAEELQLLELHPLDINSATATDLARVPLWDAFFIRNLLLYRSQHGPFTSLYDLKEVQGADLQILPLLTPYLTIETSEEPTLRPRREHYVGTQYRAGEASLLLRSTGDDGKRLEWDLIGEKDRGESCLPLREGLLDYVSGTIGYRGKGLHLIAGDVRITTGRGLLLGQSYSFFSSSIYGTGVPRPTPTRLRPHRSSREYDYIRGIGLEKELGRGLSILLFGGVEPLDAHIEGSQIVTLYRTGLHRDATARRYRRSARRETAGGYLAYDGGTTHIGLTGLLYRHRSSDGTTLLPPDHYPRRTTLGEMALDVSHMGERILVIGEVVPGPRERLATEGSLTYRDEYLGALTLSGRYYGRESISPYAYRDGHYSSGRDEWGMRLQWYGEVARYVTGTVLLDRFHRLAPDSPGGTMLLGRLSRSSYDHSSMVTARWVSTPERPRQLSLRYSGDRSWTARWTMRYGVQLRHTDGEGLGTGVDGRLRYDDGTTMQAECGVALHRLRKGQVARVPIPWMPYLYSGPMVRGEGAVLSAKYRCHLTDRLILDARLYHSITTGKTPTTDVALSVIYRQ